MIHSQDDHRNMSEKNGQEKEHMANESSLKGFNKVNFEQKIVYKSEWYSHFIWKLRTYCASQDSRTPFWYHYEQN